MTHATRSPGKHLLTCEIVPLLSLTHMSTRASLSWWNQCEPLRGGGGEFLHVHLTNLATAESSGLKATAVQPCQQIQRDDKRRFDGAVGGSAVRGCLASTP